jgi:type I restriction enzyme R subunit
MEIAGALGEKDAIPMVHAQMPLLLDLQTDEWWQDVTVPMLEGVRRRVRTLVQFIDKRSRKPLYTDFEDLLGPETEFDVVPGIGGTAGFEKFRVKARAFLRAHLDHVSIQKLRLNKPLTTSDLGELERMLLDNEVGGPADIELAKEKSHGLGIFVRSLIGLDRSAAKESLGTFLDGKRLSASQIEFVDMIVNHLTDHGVMDAALLYESPFTDLTPHGPNGLFQTGEVNELMAALELVRATAVAA